MNTSDDSECGDEASQISTKLAITKEAAKLNYDRAGQMISETDDCVSLPNLKWWKNLNLRDQAMKLEHATSAL